MIFYWTKIADQDQLQEVRQCSVNGAYYLLKFVAYNWMNQLELISHSLAQSEYFADDNPGTKPAQISTREWKEKFYKIVGITNHINYFRRQMIFFESAMTLNLERLGSFRDSHEASDINSPRALTDAWTDFLYLAARLKPFCKRADNLSTVANDLASLWAGFKSIEDSEFGLTLSVLATIIFPFTLIAAMLSMGGDFSPGQSKFWIFFASSIPLSFVIGLYVKYRESCQEFIIKLLKKPRRGLQEN
jgi:Mg2+ and Co2+ transporter CorA